MALDNFLSRMGLDTKLTDRYTEFTGPMHDQPLFYAYDPSAPAHSHGVSTKHHHLGAGHKSNAAMSALTLLAFLFFLHILQQCLKDHMTNMGTPQIMIMTAGKEGEDNIAKSSHTSKIDKAGKSNDENDSQTEMSNLNKRKITDANDAFENQNTKETPTKTLMKIKTAEPRPQNVAQKENFFKNHGGRSSIFGNFHDDTDY
ncbi:hypothetical protein RR46_13809 [Papilio xuthus]|uniref:Uncharacterized protein n=1 Tax=Papilio xuthus TaxID=66420 RepID=A0A194PHR5_PAPXU|nr:hypothetical protein RR46_13809 [Papilio xuthus]